MTARRKTIQQEIRQSKPFDSVAEEAFIALSRTADVVSQRYEHFLKKWGISGTQYNVLRILRGAGSQGLRCGEIGERMVSHDPDITRLLDRIEKLGWIERARDSKDRRVVLTRISRKGLDLLKQIDKPIQDFTRELGQHVSDQRFRLLLEVLEEIRSGNGE